MATRQDDPGVRVRLLTDALELWRGDPLGGLPASALVRDNAPALIEERLRAVELLRTTNSSSAMFRKVGHRRGEARVLQLIGDPAAAQVRAKLLRATG